MLLIHPLRYLLGRPSYIHTSSAWSASRKVLQKFKLADIGEGITECEIIKWNVKPQSAIQAFDLLCEVQSDKASVEITSPFDGVVQELLVQEGEVGKVGEGLCMIEVDEEVVDNAAPSTLEPVTPPHQEQTVQSTPNVLASETHRFHPLDPEYQVDSATANAENVFATPSTRHFAQINGVNLGLLAPGSGKNGRVEKKDVEAYLAKGADVQAVVHQADTGKDVVVELGRTRYRMWKAMVKSLEIPHFGYSTTLDLTELNKLLPVLNAHIPLHFLPPPSSPASPPSVSPSALYPAPTPPSIPSSAQFTRLTYLPILLKTLSKAMIEWPLLRSSITPSSSSSDKPSLTVRPHADISIALSTPTGLYTPTIQSVNTHTIYALSSQLKHLSCLGRQTPCSLSPAEMPKRGGTVTLSNIGAIGAGDYASPVLVPGGGVAIVAVGRAKWVWDVERGDGKGERRLKVGLSWSADHRVVEGAELAAFMECWRGYVESPARLIADSV